jgi:fructuronate reductase
MSDKPNQAGGLRLSAATLARVPGDVRRPRYDRGAIATGVFHLGPGAFHRAHQGAYFDSLLDGDPRWGICGASLRSPDVRDALKPQDWLYTLAVLDERPSLRIIGAIKEILNAPQAGEEMRARFTAPETRLVTLTITEKGYCLDARGELDLNHSDIERDLGAPRAPSSAIGWLTEGLRLRRAARLTPFIVMSCDNLSGNGRKLRAAVLRYAREFDRDLASWIEQEARFPNTMVDSITPATDAALKARVAAALGVEDAWPVQREAFTQWVIEETPGLPDLASVGADIARDVAPYEAVKLRLLNAAHSTLAYAGLLRGHETVAEAMADDALERLVGGLMREDAAPLLAAPFDVQAYIDAILSRFRNRALRHLLAQIAADGSQKLPVRVLGGIAAAFDANRAPGRLFAPVAAWMRFVIVRSRAGVALVDPLAAQLRAVGLACTDEPAHDVDQFLALSAVFPASLARDARFRDGLIEAYRSVEALERQSR